MADRARSSVQHHHSTLTPQNPNASHPKPKVSQSDLPVILSLRSVSQIFNISAMRARYSRNSGLEL